MNFTENVFGQSKQKVFGTPLIFVTIKNVRTIYSQITMQRD